MDKSTSSTDLVAQVKARLDLAEHVIIPDIGAPVDLSLIFGPTQPVTLYRRGNLRFPCARCGPGRQ